MNFHQQQQMAMAQQMAAQPGQNGGGLTPQQQQQLAIAQQMASLTPQQRQQMAMAQQMAAQYSGGMTPQQQQQLALAQQQHMEAPQGPSGGGLTPEQQQQLAKAGLTPQQIQQIANSQQRVAMTQQLATEYVNSQMGAAPSYAAPAADGTTITCQFPDGCLIGYDRLRNELILNGKISNTRMRQIPARPSPSYGADIDAGPGVPVEKTGMMTKLGWKKTMLGGDSWQPRYFRLTDTHISYHKDPNGPAINSIPLNNGIVVNVVNAATPARKNRSTNRTFFFIIPVAHFIFPVDIDQIRRQRHSWRGHSDDHEYRCHAE